MKFYYKTKVLKPRPSPELGKKLQITREELNDIIENFIKDTVAAGFRRAAIWDSLNEGSPVYLGKWMLEIEVIGEK